MNKNDKVILNMAGSLSVATYIKHSVEVPGTVILESSNGTLIYAQRKDVYAKEYILKLFEKSTNGSGFIYWGEELHETADDMFKALGWKEVDNDTSIYLIPKESDIDDLLNEYVEIDKETNRITGIFIGEKNIEEKHLAIHQKLIELGWIE